MRKQRLWYLQHIQGMLPFHTLLWVCVTAHQHHRVDYLPVLNIVVEHIDYTDPPSEYTLRLFEII